MDRIADDLAGIRTALERLALVAEAVTEIDQYDSRGEQRHDRPVRYVNHNIC